MALMVTLNYSAKTDFTNKHFLTYSWSNIFAMFIQVWPSIDLLFI